MGDCVLASSTFEAIAQSFPNAQIDLNTLSPWHRLFESDSRITTIISFPIRKQGLSAVIKWLKMVKLGEYDLILDFQNNDRTHLLLALAKCLKFTKATVVGRKKHFCYDLYPSKTPIHVVDQFFSMLSLIGISSHPKGPKLYQAPEVKKNIIDKKNKIICDESFAVFIPGCSPKHPEKRWSTEHFLEFGKLLFDTNINHIFLIGAKDETDVCNCIAEKDVRYVNLCNQTTLLEIPLWLENASIIISNDTGAAHLGANLNAPLIVLFGPTNPEQSKPYGSNVLALKSESHNINTLMPEYVFQCFQKHFHKTP